MQASAETKGSRFPPWDHLALFGLGVAAAFKLNVVGELSGTDILSVGLLPVLVVMRAHRPISRITIMVLAMAGLWFMGAALSDLQRATPPSDYARGWAKIGFFCAIFTSVSLLAGNRIRPLLYLAAGLAVAAVVTIRTAPTPLMLADPWKFGYGWALTVAALLIASSSAGPRWFTGWGRYLLVLGAAAADLAHNSRSAFGITLVALGLAAMADFMAYRGVRRVSPVRAAFLAMIVVVAGLTALEGYGWLAQSGRLGSQAQTKYLEQAGGGAGVLLGGRSETLISLRVIADSPFVGQGSWAKSREVAAEYIKLKREQRIPVYGGAALESDLIPSHSYLFGAWVEHGILGAAFWIWALCLLARSGAELVAFPRRYLPVVAYLLVALAWDILFSPFGTGARNGAALSLAAAVVVLQHARNARRADRRQPDAFHGPAPFVDRRAAFNALPPTKRG